jgi:hypothetical protein
MTALELQKPLVSDLHGQGVQLVLTLKMTYVIINKCKTEGLLLGRREPNENE